MIHILCQLSYFICKSCYFLFVSISLYLLFFYDESVFRMILGKQWTQFTGCRQGVSICFSWLQLIQIRMIRCAITVAFHLMPVCCLFDLTYNSRQAEIYLYTYDMCLLSFSISCSPSCQNVLGKDHQTIHQ